MTPFLIRLTLAAAALGSVSVAALAADVEPPPPPIEDLRPANYDWTGPYVGAFAGGIFVEGHYDATEVCGGGCGPVDPEMSGDGYQGGVLAGWNYQIDNFVVGVEGDWAWAGQVAQNRTPSERTALAFDDIATLRARAGMAFDRTLVYLTGGAVFINSTFSTDDMPTGSGLSASTSDWLTGWTVGGGIEHAYTDNIHGRLEYLYVGLPDHDYFLDNLAAGGTAGNVAQKFDSVHMVRAALTYNFSL